MSLPSSSFSLCPSGAPASQDPLSKRIYDASLEANMGQKQELVWDRVKVVVAERYDRDQRFWVAYPMLHGPVVLVKSDNIAAGDVRLVEITGVASERMVYGMVLR